MQQKPRSRPSQRRKPQKSTRPTGRRKKILRGAENPARPRQQGTHKPEKQTRNHTAPQPNDAPAGEQRRQKRHDRRPKPGHPQPQTNQERHSGAKILANTPNPTGDSSHDSTERRQPPRLLPLTPRHNRLHKPEQRNPETARPREAPEPQINSNPRKKHRRSPAPATLEPTPPPTPGAKRQNAPPQTRKPTKQRKPNKTPRAATRKATLERNGQTNRLARPTQAENHRRATKPGEQAKVSPHPQRHTAR